MSMWRSKWTMPIFFDVHCAMPRTQGKPIEWSPPSISGRAPLEATWATPRLIWSKLFSRLAGDGEHVAGVAQRHLLAQIDAELVIVGRVEGGDAPDALRPEAGAGAVGGAAVERDAEHGGVVLADVAHVLDVGRLEEGVDAGEMGQLAAGEGRDRCGRSGSRQPGRPMSSAHLLLLAPARPGQLPSASIAFQPWLLSLS